MLVICRPTSFFVIITGTNSYIDELLGLVHFVLTKTLRYMYLLFSKYLFSKLCVLGTVRGAWDTANPNR